MFDLTALNASADNLTAGAFGLSPTTQVLLLAVAAELENTGNWKGAGDELTTAEIDEIDAMVSLAESELMVGLGLGSMAFQNKEAVDIDGGTINEVVAAMFRNSVTVERDGGSPSVQMRAYGNEPVIRMRRANGSFAVPAFVPNNNSIGALAWSAWLGSDFGATIAQIRAVTAQLHTATAQGTKIEIYTTPNNAVAPAIAVVWHEDKRMEIEGDLDHDGAKAGFRGAAHIVAPVVTGSRGGNAALASALTQLALQGLIVDSSTA